MLDFMTLQPEVTIQIQGSTPERTEICQWILRNYYSNREEAVKELETEVKLLKEKIKSQRTEIELLREMLNLAKK